MKINPFGNLRIDAEPSRSINQDVFRAYDIRGIYPKDIDKEVARNIGKAFAFFLRKKTKKQKISIAVGRDNRISSPILHKALIKGIIDSGANVIDIGLSTSPMLYFSVAHYIERDTQHIKRRNACYKADGGIQISASHNPKDYNGFKLVRERAIPVGEKTGLQEIKKIILKEIVLKDELKEEKKGKILNKKVLKDYIGSIAKGVNLKKIKTFKIVVDTANAVSGILIPEVFEKTPCKIYHIFSELDGSFPNHSPDPLVKENLRDLQKEIKNKKADLGVAFDGDGDRVIFIAEDGLAVPADLIFALISDLVLKKEKGEKILYDLRSSNIVKETIEKNGGIALMGRVGHSFIKERMRKENILLAGELSGHYYFKGSYFFESPFFVLFKVLEAMSKNGKPLSELIKKYKKYFHSGEINFEVKDKDKKIKELESYFKEGKISHLDGIRIDFPDWWFNVRPSNTEQLLRLVVEAKNEKLMKEKIEIIKKLILN